MAKSEHPWCRDVQRDEAIRAAEDAAANWRRLEVGEVVQEGDEYLDPYGIWKDVTGVTRGKTYDSRTFADHRRRRVQPPDHRDLPLAVHDLRRRVEGLETVADHWRRQCEAAADAENREAAPGSREGVNADGLRTERVTLEVTIRDGRQLGPQLDGVCGVVADYIGISRQRGESARVVDDADAASDEAVAHGATLNALAEARESLAAANRGIDRLTAERDAAKEECERLRSILPPESERGRGVGEGSWAVFAQKVVAERDEARVLHVKWVELATQARIEREQLKARVAELERKCDELRSERERLIEERDAANAGVVSNPEPISGAGKSNHPGKLDSSQEPVAWGVIRHEIIVLADSDHDYARRNVDNYGGTVVPLYAAPQPPRGWLTAEEREAVERAAHVCYQSGRMGSGHISDILRALLARSTPPRVRRPRPTMVGWDTIAELFDCHDNAWIAAIRDAGGEVE